MGEVEGPWSREPTLLCRVTLTKSLPTPGLGYLLINCGRGNDIVSNDAVKSSTLHTGKLIVGIENSHRKC